jgi:hypothetical protein
MTYSQGYNQRSMRYQVDEVLSGMLASLPVDSFSDDHDALGESFKGLATEFPLFAPFAALADGADYSQALGDAFGKLIENGRLAREPGRYVLTETGRKSCISNKRSLFSNADMAQLEAAAGKFAERQAVPSGETPA